MADSHLSEQADALPDTQEGLNAALISELHSKEPHFPHVRRLLVAGADANARDEDNVPAFHSIVEWADIPTLKCALSHNTDVYSKDDYGDTPLHKAITPDVAIELLMAGASTLTYNESFRQPRHQIGLEDNSANYSDVISATRLLLQHAETIEKDASKFKLSYETLENIWPDNAKGYPGPSRPIPHPYTLRYFLHKALETGADFGKAAIFSTSKIGEAMEDMVSKDAQNVLAWNRYCDAKGTPMTARNWESCEVLEKMKPDAIAALFEPSRFKTQTDLQEIYDIHAALPAQMKSAERGSDLGTAISTAISTWLKEGEGKKLSSSGIKTLYSEMPDSVKPYFTNFHQELQTRRQSPQGIGR